jgi:hypothetical protein
MTTTENIAIEVDAAPPSGEGWGAIIGGALAATAISLILLLLGSGLGLGMISPWAGAGANVAAVAVGSVIWLIVIQWVASGFGGYLTGRLRARAEPSDEVFFRDTANGFLAWAVATLLVAAFLTSTVSAIVGTGAQVAATVASGAAQGAIAASGESAADPTAYFVDALYRPTGASSTAGPAPAPADDASATTTPAASPGAVPRQPAGTTEDLRAETGRILINGLAAQEFPPDDLTYLADRIASQTGLSADEARQRVDAVVQEMQSLKADAQAAADTARKTAAQLSLYIFLSLLIGAFIASAAAALGGQHRDQISTVARPR